MICDWIHTRQNLYTHNFLSLVYSIQLLNQIYQIDHRYYLPKWEYCALPPSLLTRVPIRPWLWQVMQYGSVVLLLWQQQIVISYMLSAQIRPGSSSAAVYYSVDQTGAIFSLSVIYVNEILILLCNDRLLLAHIQCCVCRNVVWLVVGASYYCSNNYNLVSFFAFCVVYGLVALLTVFSWPCQNNVRHVLRVEVGENVWK